MIPQKEVKFKVKDYEFKVKKEKCYNCETIDKALKNNPANLLKKLKIDYKAGDCECEASAVIHVYKKIGRKVSVGSIDIQVEDWDNENKAETHSRINPGMKNKGFGIYLYALAADYCKQNKLKLTSSGGPSDEAKRVWESKRLQKYYTIRKLDRYGLYSIKPKTGTKLAKL